MREYKYKSDDHFSILKENLTQNVLIIIIIINIID